MAMAIRCRQLICPSSHSFVLLHLVLVPFFVGASEQTCLPGSQVCSERYYKISDESNGLATSCSAVDQPADPVRGLDLAGCQASCDAMPGGCNTINFRVTDPNFNGNSTCYRKRCSSFKTAVCTLFTNHKSRDVYTKACGADSQWPSHVVTDPSGLFAGVRCPDVEVESCSETARPQTCAEPYFKIASEANGLATSCSAVEQTADPVRGLDLAGCQAACDAMPGGCNTINYRTVDPNFGGNSTCYRKRCSDFEDAVCTLFTNHKARDVYTKACGASQMWPAHVVKDASGLFAGVRCPADVRNNQTSTEEAVCVQSQTTNRANDSCSVCSVWSGGSSSEASTVRQCVLWNTDVVSGIQSCAQYAEGDVERAQDEEYQEYLQKRWTTVGVCNQNYDYATICTVTKGNRTCEVRDQPCHGSAAAAGGVAGVLSPGWRMTFDADGGSHVCTQCSRGTYGHCDDACNYRRNYFWSGTRAGKSIEVDVSAFDMFALYDAFVAEQPVEAYDNPQSLLLSQSILDKLPAGHPVLEAEGYTIISLNEGQISSREQLRTLTTLVRGGTAPMFLSATGVKVYETCTCSSCPRGTYQDLLGATSCTSCEEVLPGSSTRQQGSSSMQDCQCLRENNVFLDARNITDGLRCRSCDLVQKGLLYAPRGSCACQVDTYESAQSGQPDFFTCTHCPVGTTTFSTVGNAHAYGENEASCVCLEGFYRFGTDSGACYQCSGWQTVEDGECVLRQELKLIFGFCACGLVLVLTLGVLLLCKLQRRIGRLEEQRVASLETKMNEAISTITSLAHPMVLIRADDFVQLGRLISHEEARSRHFLYFVDSTRGLRRLRDHNRLIFFSHQWLAWGTPDPNAKQYKAMLQAIKYLQAKETGWENLEEVYVWVDFISIPQVSRATQGLAINSLPVYAGCCDVFIIVAPTAQHSATGEKCDAESYLKRAWCRAEQLSHACRLGVDHMFLATDKGLEPVRWGWLKNSFMVFNGELTCCARQHAGIPQCDRQLLVTPMLGLYAELLAHQRRDTLRPHMEEVLEFMMHHEAQMFPANFMFVRQGKSAERRELFGEVLTRLRENCAHANSGRSEMETSRHNLMQHLRRTHSKETGPTSPRNSAVLRRSQSGRHSGRHHSPIMMRSKSAHSNGVLDRIDLQESAAFGKKWPSGRSSAEEHNRNTDDGQAVDRQSSVGRHSSANRSTDVEPDSPERAAAIKDETVGVCNVCAGTVTIDVTTSAKGMKSGCEGKQEHADSSGATSFDEEKQTEPPEQSI
mmetsp:Transcript_24130/g.52665  ORF Transcript_24130/g.52665 Transcript_24130/m.52665 type:complete len:1264 (-) Transcript_24130:809-4600(-)